MLRCKKKKKKKRAWNSTAAIADEGKDIITTRDIADTIQTNNEGVLSPHSQTLSPQQQRTSSLRGDDSVDKISLPSVSDIRSVDSGSRRQSMEDRQNGLEAFSPRECADPEEKAVLAVPLGSSDSSRHSLLSRPAAGLVDGLSGAQQKLEDRVELLAARISQDLLEFSKEEEEGSNSDSMPQSPQLAGGKASYQDLLLSETPVLPTRSKNFMEQQNGSVGQLDIAEPGVSLPESVMLSLGSPYHEGGDRHIIRPSQSVMDSAAKTVIELAEDRSNQREPVNGNPDTTSSVTLDELESGMQTARLIEFHNGSFNEFLVKTPAKPGTQFADVLSRSVDMSGSDLPHGSTVASQQLSATMPVGLSVRNGDGDTNTEQCQDNGHGAKQDASSLESETERLIARYKQLRLNSQTASTERERHSFVSDDFSTNSASSTAVDRAQKILSPPLRSKHLERTPTKEIRSLSSPTFSLDLEKFGANYAYHLNGKPTSPPFKVDSLSGTELIRSPQTRSRSPSGSSKSLPTTLPPGLSRSSLPKSPLRYSTAVRPEVTPPEEQGLDDEDFSDFKQTLLAESPFTTPTGTPQKGVCSSAEIHIRNFVYIIQIMACILIKCMRFFQ